MIVKFINELRNSIQNERFIKLNLEKYKGSEKDLKSIFIKLAIVKKNLHLSFTYRYKTRDIVKNHLPNDGIERIEGFLEQFKSVDLLCLDQDHCLRFNQTWAYHAKPASMKSLPSLAHDKPKERKIAKSKPYLEALNITDHTGNVFKHAQDKYAQINHYIELLNSHLSSLNAANLNIVDMGSGKGYLTFALYDYLSQELNKNVNMTGVEYRKDMVDLCNAVAERAGFDKLKFEQGTIADFHSTEIDMLIALHACDTATDDAIYKGIAAKAALIVVAPCCHKQIRREIERSKTKNELDFLTKHGIFLERQAEMVTDSIRALLLEYAGYTTKVIQFVSDAHTPKNVMIIGVLNQKNTVPKTDILRKIKESKVYFGIEKHHLEHLMGL